MSYTKDTITKHIQKLCEKVVLGGELSKIEKRFVIIALKTFERNYSIEESLYSDVLEKLERAFNE